MSETRVIYRIGRREDVQQLLGRDVVTIATMPVIVDLAAVGEVRLMVGPPPDGTSCAASVRVDVLMYQDPRPARRAEDIV